MMDPGAQTPEQLETLLEDAFVVRDLGVLARLFAPGAVVSDARGGEARGGEQIARLAMAMWERDYTYIADPQRVLQARDTALVVGEHGINVVRRDSHGGWLFAVSLLDRNTNQGSR